MFAVSPIELPLSPKVSKFRNFWIYDLSGVHPHWIRKFEFQPDLYFASSIWEALLKAYGLSLFSPLPHLKSFAFDYFSEFQIKNIKKTKIGRHQIDTIFNHLKRLGIDRIGNLKKLSSSQIQNRFGKHWRDFFQGISSPDSLSWPWSKFLAEKKLVHILDPEHPLNHSQQLQAEISKQLRLWRDAQSSIFMDELKIEFISLENEEDHKIKISFPHKACLQTQYQWIERVLEDRLQEIHFRSPLSRIVIELKIADPRPLLQLQLFDRRQNHHNQWQEGIYQLIDRGFHIFQPQIVNSNCPEFSWKKRTPSQESLALGTEIPRPLVQFHPQPAQAPKGYLRFTERLEYFDDQALKRTRDYFITRKKNKWFWVFKDENGDWFDQGIVE